MEHLVAAISDTHVGDGFSALPLSLLDLLDQRKPDLILHAGDLTEARVLQQLDEIADTKAVRGDNDRINRLLLREKISLGDLTIVMTHGDRPWWKEFPSIYANKFFAKLGKRFRWWNGFVKDIYQPFANDQPDCIVCGHLHHPFTKYLNGTLVVNPGAVYMNGHGTQRCISPSIAFLSIKSQSIQAEIVPLDRGYKTIPNKTTMAPICLLRGIEGIV